jgi:class 3 adenylate cyclase/predicted ATPase
MVCPNCDARNPAGARFCNSCGTTLALTCPECGAPRDAAHRFCNNCGAAFAAPAAQAEPPPPAPAAGAGTAELRHVSVLFVDLVGFTAMSESRDPEDVRELLGRYFDQAKTIIARYGGTVEKFIGDAVMAVWGVPVAREDDAERSVRAALDLVEAVAVFGDEVGAPDLRARAGIVTGRVASSGTVGEGLVVGDRVNTAARVQSAADPGAVFVDEITRQVTSASIAYQDAGEHEVKGKTEPLRLSRALRTMAGVGGKQRATSLEAPFVGRDAELRLLKDIFHASVDRRGARLVGVSGPAGAGKSRLGWEFSKYTDGLADDLLWHSGRCLSYGEGVAYWALAQVVRQRLGIAEDAAGDEAAALLTAGLEEWIPDSQERARMAPALGALLGIAEPGLAREELFSSWRLFFRHLSEHYPVVLLLEDMQWADDGLLDFIEQLLELSPDNPIFVCTLARSDLLERRPGWPAHVRGATVVQLDPLGDDGITQLLRGLVPDLPEQALSRVVTQAEGIPLYAVETIKTLADRGVLVEANGHLEPVGDIGALDVPASLNSLLSARLDSLTAEEREVVKAMAVFEGSFPRSSAAAMTDIPDARLDDVLTSLVRRDIFTVRSDPLSPERGQYVFSQGLLRTVAYEMIPRRDRRPLHLAAADHLRRTFPNDGEDVVEVIAAHLLDAYRAASGDPDADDLRAAALAALIRAAQRAGSIGAPESAARLLRSAMELSADEEQRAQLLADAGKMAARAGRGEEALELLEEAVAIHTTAGRELDAARLSGSLGAVMGRAGRNEDSAALTRAALDLLGASELDPDVAEINLELGRALQFSGRQDEAAEPLARALDIAEALELPAVTARALEMQAMDSMRRGRHESARALYDGAIAIGERHRLPDRATSLSNAADLRLRRDMDDAVAACEAAVKVSAELGQRADESIAVGNLMQALIFRGRWDEAEQRGEAHIRSVGPDRHELEYQYVRGVLGVLHALRGQSDRVARSLADLAHWAESDDLESRQLYLALSGFSALTAGRDEEALTDLETAARDGIAYQGPTAEGSRLGWAAAVDVAVALGELHRLEALIGLLDDEPQGLVPPMLRAELRRAHALLAAARGEHDSVEAHLRAAMAGFIELGYPFHLARAQADLASWLIDRGRRSDAAPLLQEARATAEKLEAEPLLARIRALATPQALSA